jgi:hypothetical protein
VREVLEQIGAREDTDGLASLATTTAFVRPVSVADYQGDERDAPARSEAHDPEATRTGR